METLIVPGLIVFVIVIWQLVLTVDALATGSTLDILLIAVVVVAIHGLEGLQLSIASRHHQTQCGE
jgi:hypothetical protein